MAEYLLHAFFREDIMSDAWHINDPHSLVDLTKMVEKPDGLGPVEWAVIVVSGGVGFSGLKAIQHFFPVQASPEEQIRLLIALIEAGGKAGAKKMKFRLPANTGFRRSARRSAFQD
jgi:hypothetical protein